MSNLRLKLSRVTSWSQIEAYMLAQPELTAKIGHNTAVTANSGTAIEVTYHHHPIIVFTPETINLSLAGWDTVTTRDRLNRLTPIAVYRPQLSIRRKAHITWAGGSPMFAHGWYRFPWPPLDIVNDLEALAAWGRSVKVLEG